VDAGTVDWLLAGDPAIRWQVLAGLPSGDATAAEAERARVACDGWGARLLAEQQKSGRWAGGLYDPKWISTHYTLDLLRWLGLPCDHEPARKAAALLLQGSHADGGIAYGRGRKHSETCQTGMVLALTSYFGVGGERPHEIVAHLIDAQLTDGGWNCRSYYGATHSSFHTTILTLEGLLEYTQAFPDRVGPATKAAEAGREFLLEHRLFRSHRTGEIVHPVLTKFAFPPQWHYDVLRALDHFRAADAPRDVRLEDAVALVERRRRKDGRWPAAYRHPGRMFFELEPSRAPSRWITLRALRALQWWEGD